MARTSVGAITLVDLTDGMDGINSANVELWIGSQFAPGEEGAPTSGPIGNISYTFDGGAVSGTLGDWSVTAPALTESTPYLWKTERFVNGRNATATILPSQWSTPRIAGYYGRDGNDGMNGSDGTRGAGRWSYRVGTTLASSYSDSELLGFLRLAIGDNAANPINGDQLWLYSSPSAGTATPTAQLVYIRESNTWNQQEEVIDGDLLVAGTVTLDRLQTSNTAGTGAVVINNNGMAIFSGSETTPRVIVGNLSHTFTRT